MKHSYIGHLMRYIKLEYDNIPEEVTDDMEFYFEECWQAIPPMCLPNAAGGFWERFLKTSETL